MSSLPSSCTRVPSRPSIPSWREVRRFVYCTNSTMKARYKDEVQLKNINFFISAEKWLLETNYWMWNSESFNNSFYLKKTKTSIQKLPQGAVIITCLVAASDKFLRVQRQFWTSLWLGSVRCSPRACIPPGHSVNWDGLCSTRTEVKTWNNYIWTHTTDNVEETYLLQQWQVCYWSTLTEL